MRHTPQQEAVFAATAQRSDHLIVEAVAGSGKTTTTVQAATRCRGKTGFVAFNRHIAIELQSRLGDCADANTLHSIGHKAVLKHVPHAQFDHAKASKLLQRIMPDWFYLGRNDRWYAKDQGESVLEITRHAKLSLVDESDPSALAELVRHKGIEMPHPRLVSSEDVFDITKELVQHCAEHTESIDFDDMLWLPIRKGWSVGGYDTLFVDEAQDLSKVSHCLARAAGERLVVVGDRAQSIYGFAGAACDSLPSLILELKNTERSCLPCPLTVTFRCPRSHVTLAQKLVPAIEPAEHAVQGCIDCIDSKRLHWELLPGDLVICRTNAPLVKLVYQLITAGVPAIVRGRDVGKGLRSLIKRLRPDNCADLLVKLHAWHDSEIARLERTNASEQQLESVSDRVECIATLVSQCPTLGELYAFLDQVFGDESDADKVILSSIHRAKGLEAERVVILEPEKMPMIRQDSQPWQIQQEKNLLYIAVTRSKRELFFAGNLPAIFNGGLS